MGKRKSNLGSEELGLVLREHADLDQMAEELATLDELHKEVDAVVVLEDVLHVYKEGVVDLAQDILLQLNVLHLFVLEDNVLADDLHCVQLMVGCVFDQEDFAKRALADHLADLEVLQRGWRLLITSEDSSSATDHRLTYLHVSIAGL